MSTVEQWTDKCLCKLGSTVKGGFELGKSREPKRRVYKLTNKPESSKGGRSGLLISVKSKKLRSSEVPDR